MMLKKILLPIVFIAIALLLYWCFIPKYKFHYYYSKNKTQMLTRVTYPNILFTSNDTYFTPGRYAKHKIPTTYVKPRYSSDRDWAVYITFHSKGIFLMGGNSAEVMNLTSNFLYRPGSYKYYAEHLADNNLTATFKQTENFAVYSFDD